MVYVFWIKFAYVYAQKLLCLIIKILKVTVNGKEQFDTDIRKCYKSHVLAGLAVFFNVGIKLTWHLSTF